MSNEIFFYWIEAAITPFSKLWNNRQLKSSRTWMSWIIMHFDKESECLSNDFCLLQKSTRRYVIKEPIFGPTLFSNNMDQYCGWWLPGYYIWNLTTYCRYMWNHIALINCPTTKRAKNHSVDGVLTDLVLGWFHSKNAKCILCLQINSVLLLRWCHLTDLGKSSLLKCPPFLNKTLFLNFLCNKIQIVSRSTQRLFASWESIWKEWS